MKDIILEYIQEQFGERDAENHNHYSYCSFPEEECICRRLSDITYDTPLITGGYIDSFSMVAVLVFLERRFKIKIADADGKPANFDTVDEMVKLVKKYTNE
jgi:acyl carrier protein